MVTLPLYVPWSLSLNWAPPRLDRSRVVASRRRRLHDPVVAEGQDVRDRALAVGSRRARERRGGVPSAAAAADRRVIGVQREGCTGQRVPRVVFLEAVDRRRLAVIDE